MQWFTGVSRGGLYDCVPRLEGPSSLSIFNHPQADPVLHTSSSVEELTLGHCTRIHNNSKFIIIKIFTSLKMIETLNCLLCFIQQKNNSTMFSLCHCFKCLFSGSVSAWWVNDSHISHLSPNALGILLIRTMGVSPILCRMFGRMEGETSLGGANEIKKEKIKSKLPGIFNVMEWEDTCFCLSHLFASHLISHQFIQVDFLWFKQTNPAFSSEKYRNPNSILTWEFVHEGSRPWRLPCSMCSGWGGQVWSISSQDLCSLCWSEWSCWSLHGSLPRSPFRLRWLETSPPGDWLLRCRGCATWQHVGTWGFWRKFLWMKEQTAWFTLGKNRKRDYVSERYFILKIKQL